MSDNVQKASSSILCDMCTEEDRKAARKTCMKCEISMCVQHLQAHLTTPVLLQTHPLTEPMAIDGNTKCPQHGKLLEYYCLDDKTCVCVSCAIEDQHRLHNMKTFSTAHKELLEKLKAEQEALQVKTEDDNMSLEKWEKSEREKVARCSVRLIEAVTNLRDVSLTSVQSSVSARMVSIRTSRSSMEAAQNEKDTFRFLQMYSQVNQDVEKAKAVDLRKGLEPGSHRDKLVLEIRQNGEKMVNQASNFLESLLSLVDPESQQDLNASSDLIFEPQSPNCCMSLSSDKRTVFYNSDLGQCSATLLIRSTLAVPIYRRWMLGLTDEADWMIGLCDKQSAGNLKNGPVYGLRYEDKRLSWVTTKYHNGPYASSNSSVFEYNDDDTTTTGKQLQVCSTSLTSEKKDGDEEDQRPEMVEVFWDFVASRLSFFSRSGQYQRKAIITIETTPNNWDLVPFVRLGKENVENTSQPDRKCSCGRSSPFYQTNCSRCGKKFSDLFTSEVVCELC
ncbi:tripartite motif-containing protein 16 [Fundulus heteroclitus]|uniref:tripartite motif-containing protein 16 n=1 Tax=Fundulus heteroclitus TaxID=8078 RepID=UPI00165CD920|nr:tripartite motif-containing protein 16 [Fundulus heteroclitus]